MEGRVERQRAVEDLHARYAVAIYHKCKRMIGDAAEAEDAVQETFVRAYKSLDSFVNRPSEEHLYWLYRTASYVCLHLLRTRRRRRIAATPRSVEETAHADSGQEQRVGARMELDQVLGKLDERDQMIVVAHFIDGMNQGEVAAALGVSRRAVVKRLTSLRRRVGPGLQEAVAHG